MVRNPIRLKNLRARFLPLYVVGVLALIFLPPDPSRFGLALPAIGIGTALRSWGAGHLVKNHALTTTGPYAHLRHPLYLGTLLVGSGFAWLVGGWIAFAALAVLWPWFAFRYFPRKERSESARLAALYGPRFERYRTAVPALWPRLRAWRDPDESGDPVAASGWRLERYSDNNELGTLLAILAGVLVFALRASGGAA
ncbi:MAG: isoprenylcysteine carboxylmethyltransferase family protein [Spirochaetaceae bacterium]|nr:isoprenylcysteine carboxylmethyltransferase family protein [Myxococcales bacterium]MCB9723447.1 isoprenylcysteine carboxylmethyltransferase family protein [Spirochaetaceae bacterium]